MKVKNNRWTYEDRTTRLEIGTVIYLWIHVVYDGLGYNLLDQVHRVTSSNRSSVLCKSIDLRMIILYMLQSSTTMI